MWHQVPLQVSYPNIPQNLSQRTLEGCLLYRHHQRQCPLLVGNEWLPQAERDAPQTSLAAGHEGRAVNTREAMNVILQLQTNKEAKLTYRQNTLLQSIRRSMQAKARKISTEALKKHR